MTQKTITYLSIIIIALGFIFLANGLILAWSPPGSAPPAGNVPAPLNTGSSGQSKAGGLILNTGGATNGLIVDKGRVGIGKASPGAKLHIKAPDNGWGGGIRLEDDASSNYYDIIYDTLLRFGYNGTTIGYMDPSGNFAAYGSLTVGNNLYVSTLRIDGDSINRTDNGPLYIAERNTSGIAMGDPSSQIYAEIFGWLRTAGNGVAYGSYGKTKYYTIMANGANRTGGGIAVSDDGGFFDWNDGYITYEPLCCNQGFRVNSNIYVNGRYNSPFCDIAESYEPSSDSQELEPGDIVVLDEQEEMKVKKSTEPYSSLVIGIVSTNPNMVMGVLEGDEDHPPVALLGHVPTKVTTENGPVKIGDLIVTSSKPGYGMKCDDYDKCQGAVVGKALQNLENGEGLIEVLMRGAF